MKAVFKVVKPKNPKDLVFNPATKRKIKDEGEEVAWSSYWQRRLRAGEIIIVESAPKSEPKKSFK